jgi:hypothetical protein
MKETLSSDKTYWQSKKFRGAMVGLGLVTFGFISGLMCLYFNPDLSTTIENIFLNFTRTIGMITIVLVGGQSAVDAIADYGKTRK